MLSELEVVIFLKSNDDLARAAARVFGALNSQYTEGSAEEAGATNYQAQGMGFKGVLYANAGDLQDPEFGDYPLALEITSIFADVELDPIDLEGMLAEYFARLLAFDLGLETAAAILVEEREDAEVLEIRAFNRNTQYRSDSGPTVPKVHIVETREIEVPLTGDEWQDGEPFDDDREAEDT